MKMPMSTWEGSSYLPRRGQSSPIFIDEVMLHQHMYKIATPKDQNVLTELLFQLGYFFCNILFDQS